MPSRYTFQITDPNTNNRWSCPIHCQQCTHLRPNANNARCRNRTCFGSPLCWIHNSQRFGVKSRVSTIPGAGKGLFATRQFHNHDWICPMVGENLTGACVEQRYPGEMTAPYVEYDEGNSRYTDCACSRGIGSLANARFRANGQLRHRNAHNAITEWRVDGIPGFWLKARRNINIGDEIFLWYGDGGYQLENTHTTRRRANIPDSRPC